MVCHHDSGTGGFCQTAGSERPPEWVGITNVPPSPMASRRASTTAWDAPGNPTEPGKRCMDDHGHPFRYPERDQIAGEAASGGRSIGGMDGRCFSQRALLAGGFGRGGGCVPAFAGRSLRHVYR